MTISAVAVPLTAVLCTTISSVITGLVTTLIMYCFVMKGNKKNGSDEDGKHNPQNAEPIYDTPQGLGEGSADIELKENTCYASKSDAQ